MQAILERGERKSVRALLGFNSGDSDEEVRVKFNLWLRYFFPAYVMDDLKSRVIEDSEDHRTADLHTIRVYRGTQPVFLDIEYRGAAKTTRKKLFLGFAISNDEEHRRRYIKILAEDDTNSEQAATDIFNMFVNRRHAHFYPELLVKTPEKRVERMGNFETATGVKVLASTVGVMQRGQLQDENRPDLIWFDDFESRKTLRSAITLQKVWENMEEARTGLSRTGGVLYTCNYLSERGNVHKLIQKYHRFALIIPIKGKVKLHVDTEGNVDVRHVDGPPRWPSAYTVDNVEQILALADDPAGEYLSCPAAGDDVFFPRRKLDKQERGKPIETIAGFKIFDEFDPSHRYASGHDIAGGVGLDHSTSVFIDFSQTPNRVVATFKSNRILPDIFGDEIKRQARIFGNPLVAPENNNYGHATIARLKQIYDNERIYTMKEKETRAGAPTRVRQWGWNTNSATKPEMFASLRKAVKDNALLLIDPDLHAEARAYTRDDLMDTEIDPRLATRHFDLLTACAIAWAMRFDAEEKSQGYEQAPYEPSSEYETSGVSKQESTARPRVAFGKGEDFVQPAYEGESEYVF